MSVFTSDVVVEGGNLIAVKVDGSAVTQPVSGTFFQATQPISGTITAVQPTGTNLHVVVDSGTITTNTGSGSTATITQVNVTNAASVVLLASNVNRKKAIIFIPTIGTKLFIGFAAVTNSTTTFSYSFSTNNTALEVVNYTGIISAIATGATDVVQVTEMV